MIEALVALDRLAEMRQSFIGDALASAAEIDAGVALFTMQDVHEYIVNEAAVKAASIKKTTRVQNPKCAKKSSNPRRRVSSASI